MQSYLQKAKAVFASEKTHPAAMKKAPIAQARGHISLILQTMDRRGNTASQ